MDTSTVSVFQHEMTNDYVQPTSNDGNLQNVSEGGAENVDGKSEQQEEEVRDFLTQMRRVVLSNTPFSLGSCSSANFLCRSKNTICLKLAQMVLMQQRIWILSRTAVVSV